MGKTRTYIPGILAVADYLKKYLASHVTTLEKYLGKGGVAVLQLVVDLLIIIAQLIDENHEVGQDWAQFDSVEVLDSGTLTSVQAAISKFYETIGVTP